MSKLRNCHFMTRFNVPVINTPSDWFTLAQSLRNHGWWSVIFYIFVSWWTASGLSQSNIVLAVCSSWFYKGKTSKIRLTLVKCAERTSYTFLWNTKFHALVTCVVWTVFQATFSYVSIMTFRRLTKISQFLGIGLKTEKSGNHVKSLFFAYRSPVCLVLEFLIKTWTFFLSKTEIKSSSI